MDVTVTWCVEKKEALFLQVSFGRQSSVTCSDPLALVMFRTRAEHMQRLEGLFPLESNSGRSSSIFIDPVENTIVKVQYLLKVPYRGAQRYFSVQLFHPDLERHGAALVHFFETGRLPVRNPRLAERALRKMMKRLVSCCTHDFIDEIRALDRASEAGVTPPLHEWYICETGHGVALGVFVQARAGTTLAAMQPCELVHLMHHMGPMPFVELLKACAVAGLAHLDLIPSNIVVYQGRPRLIDFGICIRNVQERMSEQLRTAYFFFAMLGAFAKHCHLSANNTVYMCGSEVPVTSADYHMLRIEFFPQLVAQTKEAQATLLRLWRQEFGGQCLLLQAGAVVGSAQKRVRAGVGEEGEKLYTVVDNIELVDS